MISTRDNLLIRPWELRKYEHHQKKVRTATPVIDTKSPPYRPHVAVKMKKLQKESERSEKIEKDNLILLRRLRHIMTNHWLDNYLPPQPTFLNRIGVYRPVDSGIGLTDDDQLSQDGVIQEEALNGKPQCRKLKCVACSPLRMVEKVRVSEERVPWEPQKKPVARQRSKSVPPKLKTEEPPRAKTRSAVHFKERPVPTLPQHPNHISLSRGSLKLTVNFPVDTVVKFDKSRLAQQKMCGCCRKPGLA